MLEGGSCNSGVTSKAGVFAFAAVIQIVLAYIIIPGFEILFAFFKSSEENHKFKYYPFFKDEDAYL